MAIVDLLQFSGKNNSNVSNELLQNQDLTQSRNCRHTYQIGEIWKRLGYSKVGATIQADKAITGLYQAIAPNATTYQYVTANNSAGTNLQMKYRTTGAWANITVGATYDGFEDAKTEWATILGYTIVVGYDATDNVFLPTASLTGTTFSEVTNVTGAPEGKYIIKYRERVCIANAYSGAAAHPYRVYFSSVPSAGAITWTVATDFIDVDHGEEIIGMGVNFDTLVIFTRSNTYFISDLGSTNVIRKKQTWGIGCEAHRSIKNYNDWMIWANSKGVWVSGGGRPQNVGIPKRKFLEAVTDWSAVHAAVVDQYYYLYLGDVTVDSISYTNYALVFDIENNSFDEDEYDDNFTVFATMFESGQERLYGGAADGDVHNFSKFQDTSPVYSDNTAAISSSFRTKFYHFGLPSKQKSIDQLWAYADRGNGLNLSYNILDERKSNKWDPIGQMSKSVERFDVDIKGYNIKFEGRESSVNPPFKFTGMSIYINEDTKKGIA